VVFDHDSKEAAIRLFELRERRAPVRISVQMETRVNAPISVQLDEGCSLNDDHLSVASWDEVADSVGKGRGRKSVVLRAIRVKPRERGGADDQDFSIAL